MGGLWSYVSTSSWMTGHEAARRLGFPTCREFPGGGETCTVDKIVGHGVAHSARQGAKQMCASFPRSSVWVHCRSRSFGRIAPQSIRSLQGSDYCAAGLYSHSILSHLRQRRSQQLPPAISRSVVSRKTIIKTKLSKSDSTRL